MGGCEKFIMEVIIRSTGREPRAAERENSVALSWRCGVCVCAGERLQFWKIPPVLSVMLYSKCWIDLNLVLL